MKIELEKITKVSLKSQIVLRKEFRKATGIVPGSIVRTKLEGKKIIIEKLDADKELEKVEKIAKMVGKRWPKGLSAVEAIRQERR